MSWKDVLGRSGAVASSLAGVAGIAAEFAMDAR
jgi:hypothetical protein